jgi:hypothetical protein
MDCVNIITRCREIRREARRAEEAIKSGDSTRCGLAMSVLELHLQAIRAELDSRRKELR